jgi:hypothetical protein
MRSVPPAEFARQGGFVVGTSGTCSLEPENSKKRRALIAWCDELIAQLRARRDSRFEQLREETQALRDRLATRHLA